MVFKKFTWGVIIRLSLLTVVIATSVVVWLTTSFIFTQLILSAVAILLLLEIFRFITKTNKDLSKFINAINYNDYQVHFSGYGWDNAFGELHQAFRSTIQKFKELKLEKEAHYQYLQLLVKHIEVGIISFNQKGEVRLFNGSAAALLKLPQLKSLQPLKSAYPDFVDRVAKAKSGAKFTYQLANNSVNLSVSKQALQLEGDELQILVFQDINSALNQQETSSWNKLIKVLTHEIMNSVTPVISLSDTLISLNAEQANPKIEKGLQTIKQRSQRMLEFVNDYRQLVALPAPNKKPVSVQSFLQNIERLQSAELELNDISFEMSLPASDFEILVDEGQLEQVLLNLLSNAIYALSDSKIKTLKIWARIDSKHGFISVKDTGSGIDPEILGDIFVPFYSTKPKGSGIGLSLARQIMHQHGGQLLVESVVGQGTEFTLQIPR
ncbi:MAG: HAMP domain-containing histidine kinase [Bacteroidetes bacterium]|nr:HAMP domain-containing histidine kinase [Bacteroidota bacterium]